MSDLVSGEAIFGAFDGAVSVIGFVFALLVHGSPGAAIAVGALGGACSATVSMGMGDYEQNDGQPDRLQRAFTMAAATFVGSLAPAWPFFVFARRPAVTVAGVCCLGIAGWIGWVKHRGWKGYVGAYARFLVATGITLIVIAVIPGSVGA